MYLVRNLSGLNTAVMTCSGSAMGLTWGDMCDVFIAFNSCLSAKMADITCPTAHPARWGELRSPGSRAGGRDRPGGCPTWSYRWMPRKMSTTSWARPFTTSPMALPAAAASPATFCPAGVQRNTKRLPAANSVGLAALDLLLEWEAVRLPCYILLLHDGCASSTAVIASLSVIVCCSPLLVCTYYLAARVFSVP